MRVVHVILEILHDIVPAKHRLVVGASPQRTCARHLPVRSEKRRGGLAAANRRRSATAAVMIEIRSLVLLLFEHEDLIPQHTHLPLQSLVLIDQQ